MPISAAIPSQVKGSTLFQLKPRSPQVIPIEEFPGKMIRAVPLASSPDRWTKTRQGRASRCRCREPSQSSWVKVKQRLSGPKGAESGDESETNSGTVGRHRQEEQLPQIAWPGSPGRCGPGACLGWSGIWGTWVTGNALWGHLEDALPPRCLWRAQVRNRSGRPMGSSRCISKAFLQGLL